MYRPGVSEENVEVTGIKHRYGLRILRFSKGFIIVCKYLKGYQMTILFSYTVTELTHVYISS